MATLHRLDTTLAGPPVVDRAWAEVAGVLDDPSALALVFQPIASLATGAVVGFEALARFRTPAQRDPAGWFDLAWGVGLGAALEARTVELALDAADRPAGNFLTVNLSPSALGSRRSRRSSPGPSAGSSSRSPSTRRSRTTRTSPASWPRCAPAARASRSTTRAPATRAWSA